MAGIENKALTPGLRSLSPAGFIEGLLKFLVNAALIISAIAFLFMFILGGIAWITSGSDKQALEAARRRVLNSIIGFVVVLSVFALVKFIEAIFNIQILQFNLTDLAIV